MTPAENRHLAIQSAYAAATRSGNADAMSALCQPEAVVWHNYDELEVDSTQSNRTLSWLHRAMPDARWDDRAVHATSSGFVWQAVITGTGPSGPVRAHTCMVVTVSTDGRVIRTEEYLDPVGLAGLSARS